MSARQLIVLAVAALAAIGALFMFRNLGPSQTEAAASTPVAGEHVLVAARDIAQGAALTPSDIAARLFPRDSISAAMVRTAAQPSAQADLVGAVTRRAFVQGEPITSGSVVQPDGRGFMAAQLRPGYRAVAMEIAAGSAAGGYIQPNDLVDVILTATTEALGDTGAGQSKRSEIVLAGVRVLALDDKVQTQASGGAPERIEANIAVLELSAADARALALADALGDLSLTLRGVETEAAGMRAPSAQSGLGGTGQQGGVRVHAFGAVVNGSGG